MTTTAVLMAIAVSILASGVFSDDTNAQKRPKHDVYSSLNYFAPYNVTSTGLVHFPTGTMKSGIEDRRGGGLAGHASHHHVLYGVGGQRYTPAISRRVCQLYPDRGSCAGHVRAWYWDSIQEKCRTFNYGGCKGNGNNFITEKECRSVCDPVYRRTVFGNIDYLPKPQSSTAHRAPLSGKGHAHIQPLKDVHYDGLGLHGGHGGYGGLGGYDGSPGLHADVPIKHPTSCGSDYSSCGSDTHDYPRSFVSRLISQYNDELKRMYHELYETYPEDRAAHNYSEQISGRSSDELTARHGSGEFVCESEERYSSPGWARTIKGLWQLVLNTPAFPQPVRVELCRYEGRRCNYLPPCMESVCVQRYAVVKVLCASGLNILSRPRIQEVQIPSGCSCFLPGPSGDFWHQPWARSGPVEH